MKDFRSDTVTRPTAAMRQAMAEAEVGDDVWGEDPTVNRLEAEVAELFGHEAAVFACSGTQSNQMGLRVHCIPGDELLIHETGHICNFEGGAPAALSGISVRTVSGAGGMPDVADLEGRVRPDDQHFPRTRLVCLENTTNLGGGRVFTLEHLQRVSEWCLDRGLKRHLDGARVFNALAAGCYSPRQLGACFDTISICFSKGLGCPLGSILIGSRVAMQQARRVRKIFGGGLRQSGIVAAAALYALEHHVSRLQEDHANARTLAEGLAKLPGLKIDPATVETNLVFFEIDPEVGTAVQVAAALREEGILAGPMGGQRMRMVTHLDVNARDVQDALNALGRCLQQGVRDRPVLGTGPFSK
jgi:threonine aldolase